MATDWGALMQRWDRQDRETAKAARPTRYRECSCGDVSLDYVDGKWEVLWMASDVGEKRRHRFWIVAFLDYITC